jgi:hypothetical protein
LEIKLQYGCPSCGGLKTTGEYEWREQKKEQRSILVELLWRLKIVSKPTKTVTIMTKHPIYSKVPSGFIHLNDPLQSTRATPFHCPHCNSNWTYQVREQPNGETKIQWGHGSWPRDYEVIKCPKCRGQFTNYVNINSRGNHDQCRACGFTYEHEDPVYIAPDR